jgi:NADPH2:quinone reductase
MPLAALTAAIGLYANDRLNLPSPLAPATVPIPLVVYGGSSAVGAYAIQLAKRSNIHPIIAIAGRAQDHVTKLLDASKGDVVLDYRAGDDAVVQGIKSSLKGQKLEYAYDATAEHNSWANICQVLDRETGKITLVLPPTTDIATGKHEGIPAGVRQSMTNVAEVQGAQADIGYLFSRYFTKGLEEGWFRGQPQEECPGGLEGIEGALKRLKDGSASATKFVFKIADTPGAGSGK